MDRNQLYKEQYDLEWSHRAHLLSMTNFCMVAATVIGTALVAAAQSFNYTSGYGPLFISFFLVSLTFLAAALFHISKSFIGQEYRYMPTSEQIEGHYAHLQKWRQEKKVGGEPNAEFEDYLLDRFAEAASANFYTNRMRASFVQSALMNVVWSLVFLAASAIPYLLGSTGMAKAVILFFTGNPQ